MRLSRQQGPLDNHRRRFVTGSQPACVTEVATLLHKGQRKMLEDRLHVGSWWWVLADGMGGQGAGDLAASAAVKAAAAALSRTKFAPRNEAEADALLDAVGDEAQQAVVDAAFNSEVLTAGSTLLVLLLSSERRLHVGWVGDSRAYVVAGGEVVQKTRDHTAGARTQAAGPNFSDGGLTRHLGYRAARGSEMGLLDTTSCDQPASGRVVLCSDGVWSAVRPAEFDAIVRRAGTATGAASDLRKAVLAAGAPDNFAAVVIDFVSVDGPSSSSAPPD